MKKMKEYELRKNGTRRIATKNEEVSKTDPSHKDDVCVNNIMKRYANTGIITHLNKNDGTYADVSEVPNLSEAMQHIVQANMTFRALPANVRRKFNNQPVEYLKWLEDPANDAEAIQLGLRVAPEKPEVRETLPEDKKNEGTSKKDT